MDVSACLRLKGSAGVDYVRIYHEGEFANVFFKDPVAPCYGGTCVVAFANGGNIDRCSGGRDGARGHSVVGEENVLVIVFAGGEGLAVGVKELY